MTVHNPYDAEAVADVCRANTCLGCICDPGTGENEGVIEHDLDLAVAILDALSSRLLPRDGEERTETKHVHRDDMYFRECIPRRCLCLPTHSRTVTSYPDGTVKITSWKEINDGE